MSEEDGGKQQPQVGAEVQSFQVPFVNLDVAHLRFPH